MNSLASDTDHRVALLGPLLISVWIHETRLDALMDMEQMIRVWAPRVPGGRLGLFVVLEHQAKMISSEARSELSRIRRTNPIGLTALVHEGNGFGAALVRGITTSLNLLEPLETHTHVFANVKSAANWIESKAPQYGAASPIEAAVHALRTSPT